MTPITFHTEPRRKDRAELRKLLESTGLFHDFEIDVAIELLDDRLEKGERSEYRFVFAESEGVLLGYTCYGPITVTDRGFDLYWIAVRNDRQRRGIGRRLLQETERLVKEAHGRHIVSETSAREVYKPTREFYRRSGFTEMARIPNFYAENDGKVIFMKFLDEA